MTLLYKVVIHVAIIGMVLTYLSIVWDSECGHLSRCHTHCMRVKETFFGVYSLNKSSMSPRLHVGVASTMAADETDMGNEPNQALHTLYQKLYVRAPRRVGPTVSKPTRVNYQSSVMMKNRTRSRVSEVMSWGKCCATQKLCCSGLTS